MKTEFIKKIQNLGESLYPTPSTKYGFSVRQFAEKFLLNHATLNSWLNGKTSPTKRQSMQLEQLIDHLKMNQLASESYNDYQIDYKQLYNETQSEIERLKLKNQSLKEKLNEAEHKKKRLGNKIT